MPEARGPDARPDARIVFHLPAKHLEDWRQTRHLALFQRIAETLGPRDAKIVTRDRRDGPFRDGETRHYADGDLHILDTGRARGPGVLNASVAYLPPFWHLDPAGMQAESSIGARVYDSASVPLKPAMAFLDRMRQRHVLPRQSRRAQPETVETFPQGALSVFLQGTQPHENGLTWCSTPDLLRAVARGAAAAGIGPVLVKPHPLGAEEDARAIAKVIAEGHALCAVTANVHDMIAASVATVSFNSAVALEGFLHRKPAILFGPSDFHHFAQMVRQPGDFPQALADALTRPPGGYAKFLHWYFVQNCLNIGAPSFAARLEAILTAAGFPPARLGLAEVPADG